MKYWSIVGYLHESIPFVGCYEHEIYVDFKELFQPRVVFKDDHTVFDVNLYKICIYTDRPKNTINVFLHEIDWIFSECRDAKYLYLPLLRQLLKLNYKPPKET